jgi:hypothetical protein
MPIEIHCEVLSDATNRMLTSGEVLGHRDSGDVSTVTKRLGGRCREEQLCLDKTSDGINGNV